MSGFEYTLAWGLLGYGALHLAGYIGMRMERGKPSRNYCLHCMRRLR